MTRWLLVLAAVVIYDLYVWHTAGLDYMLSRQLLFLDQEFPITKTVFAFGLGVLFGHFFWPQQVKPNG